MSKRMRVGIVVFDDVEVLDFCGPFEALSVTCCDETRRNEDSSPFQVQLVGPTLEPVVTVGKMRALPDTDFARCPPLDILIVPGGWGTRREVNNPAMIEFIRRMASQTPIVASVCTGSFLLAEAGLLDGKRATTHWKSLRRMQETYPSIDVSFDEHVVCNEQPNPWAGQPMIWTSAGISAGIDLTLKLVAHLYGEQVARGTADHMEYPFPDSSPAANSRRVARTAIDAL